MWKVVVAFVVTLGAGQAAMVRPLEYFRVHDCGAQLFHVEPGLRRVFERSRFVTGETLQVGDAILLDCLWRGASTLRMSE